MYGASGFLLFVLLLLHDVVGKAVGGEGCAFSHVLGQVGHQMKMNKSKTPAHESNHAGRCMARVRIICLAPSNFCHAIIPLGFVRDFSCSSFLSFLAFTLYLNTHTHMQRCVERVCEVRPRALRVAGESIKPEGSFFSLSTEERWVGRKQPKREERHQNIRFSFLCVYCVCV